jgi:hypothetical protein
MNHLKWIEHFREIGLEITKLIRRAGELRESPLLAAGPSAMWLKLGRRKTQTPIP